MGAQYNVNCHDSIRDYKCKEQVGGTCYAYAIAGIICLSSERVHGRKKLDFYEIKDEIIKKYGNSNGGGNVRYILLNSGLLSKYRLRCEEIDHSKAYIVLCQSNPRPIVATFFLDAKQWNAFSNFFRQNKSGILYPINLKDYYDPNKTDESGSHAVIIKGMGSDHLHISYFIIANSWGDRWGEEGFFKVSVSIQLVTPFTFYDVFWLESDLTREEREKYKRDYPYD